MSLHQAQGHREKKLKKEDWISGIIQQSKECTSSRQQIPNIKSVLSEIQCPSLQDISEINNTNGSEETTKVEKQEEVKEVHRGKSVSRPILSRSTTQGKKEDENEEKTKNLKLRRCVTANTSTVEQNEARGRKQEKKFEKTDDIEKEKEKIINPRAFFDKKIPKLGKGEEKTEKSTKTEKDKTEKSVKSEKSEKLDIENKEKMNSPRVFLEKFKTGKTDEKKEKSISLTP